MKKSTRILSVILALTMLLGIFSVMGSAYKAYRDAGITEYDDLDKPVFDEEQYATMALEALDKLLAEKKIYLTPDQLFNLTDKGLDLRNINTAIASVAQIYDNVSGLLSIAGDANLLSIDAFYVNNDSTQPLKKIGVNGNNGNVTHVQLILAVLQFLEDNKVILTKYVGHNLSLGALQSVVSKYLFDVRELLFKVLYWVMNKSYEIIDGDPAELPYNTAEGSGDIDVAVRDLLYYALFGKHTKVNGEYVLPDKDDYKGLIWDFLEDEKVPAAEIDQIKADLDINANVTAYDFIEKLMVNAFNYIAVPELNNVTRPWLREVCGIVYDKDKMDPKNPNYDENYDGEEPDADHPLDPQLAAIFDVDGMHIPKYDSTFPGYDSSKTFIGNFNAYFGYVLECVLAGSASDGDWTWTTANGDADLLKNICSVAKFILKNSGDKFFEPYITVYSGTQIAGWSDQEVVSYVLRVILNESVSWMYIDDNQKTIADVCYAAVEQLAWQDLPQFSYTKPVRADYSSDYDYYAAIVESALDILMDVAAYKINPNIDMVVAKRTATSPAENAGSGLLEYCHDYEVLAVQIATWAVHNYAGMLTANGCTFSNLHIDPARNGTVGGTTAAQVWADLDTIINALVPIKGNSAWIHSEIANQSLVLKSLLFEYLVYPVLNIEDVSNVEKILSRNTNGELASHTTKKALIDLVTRVINAIFPNTINESFNSLDAVVVNSKLATIVGNLIDSLHTHGADWIGVALPVVCDLLHFTDAQKFGEMECYMPEIVKAGTDPGEINGGITFEVYNGSSGVNTSYTNSTGNWQQDALYVYEIQGVSVSSTSGTIGASGLAQGNTLAGGAFKNITVTGTGVTEDSLITLNITYKVKGETGAYLAGGATLACTKYCYVDSTDRDDSETRVDSPAGNGYTLKAAPSVYANKNTSLKDALGYAIAVKDDVGNGQVIRVSNVTTSAPWIELNSEASVTTSSSGVTWTLNPFQVKEGFVRLSESYNVASDVNASNFATYGHSKEEAETATTRKTDLYTRNDNGYSYTIVAQNAEYDAGETYYTYKTNVDPNNPGHDEKGNTIITDGTFTATFTVTTPSGSASETVTIFLYDDKGLESLYNNAVAANRQSGQFTNAATEWNAYKPALENAGLLVLNPKKVSEFPDTIGQYADKYEQLYKKIKALDKKANENGVDTLQAAIGNVVANGANNGYYSNNYYLESGEVNTDYIANGNDPEKAGWNDVQYWAVAVGNNYNGLAQSRYAYSYFGMRDYVGHDYKKFRDARNSAQSIIDSQVVYPPIPPEHPGPNATTYQMEKYNEAMEAYDAEHDAYLVKAANIPALNAVAVAYAQSMVVLTGSRLIELPGDKSKLSAFRTTYEKTTQGNYSASTWEEYTFAKKFADWTIGDPSARPEQITEALSQYVRAYKRLCSGVNYTALDAEIITSAAILGRQVADVASEINALDADYSDAEAVASILTEGDPAYTAESAEAFASAFVAAIDTRKADLGQSTANENTVAERKATLEAARLALVIDMGSSEPVIEMFDPENLPDGYFSPFYRDDMCENFIPELDNTLPLTYLGDEDMYLITGIGVAYWTCEPADVFQTLENCYAVWERNEMGSGSTGSYITIYTDENCDTEIVTYYVLLYGDCDGNGDIDGEDSLFIDTMIDEYSWDGITEHWVMAQAGDVDGDWAADANDSIVTDGVVLGQYTINQDHERHFNYAGVEQL